MNYNDYFTEKMKDPEFRAAVKKHAIYMKRWGWLEEIRAWIEYFKDWWWEKFF